MDINVIRRANLAKLLPQYPSQAALARAAGISPQALSSLLIGQSKSFGEKAARTIERGLHLESGWLDRSGDTDKAPIYIGVDAAIIELARRIQALTPRDRDTLETLLGKLEGK